MFFESHVSLTTGRVSDTTTYILAELMLIHATGVCTLVHLSTHVLLLWDLIHFLRKNKCVHNRWKACSLMNGDAQVDSSWVWLQLCAGWKQFCLCAYINYCFVLSKPRRVSSSTSAFAPGSWTTFVGVFCLFCLFLLKERDLLSLILRAIWILQIPVNIIFFLSKLLQVQLFHKVIAGKAIDSFCFKKINGDVDVEGRQTQYPRATIDSASLCTLLQVL